MVFLNEWSMHALMSSSKPLSNAFSSSSLSIGFCSFSTIVCMKVENVTIRLEWHNSYFDGQSSDLCTYLNSFPKFLIVKRLHLDDCGSCVAAEK